MKMLIVSARMIPAVGEGWSEGKAVRQPMVYRKDVYYSPGADYWRVSACDF